ncbi:cyclic AMP-responsive element-binding protein 3-like protein 4 isoform X1 [Alosa sapidissima]|uniref:cyclic AMP-responsive element-binding protein 3-like protein 4 isoform X1 n=2 Tax=Alosa sapidissima TaxID=34773 RepID=UPI001C07F664|nr:cyclic AMP-responsive element-binding protein 3-like protein 4 isoform X1 [Alosa sapidissima]
MECLLTRDCEDMQGRHVTVDMDAENGEVFFRIKEEDAVMAEDLHNSTLSGSHALWSSQSVLNDSETEDVLHAINPNDMYTSGLLHESLSESDSGMSADPQSDSPLGTIEASQDTSVPTVYQVVYDISAIGGIKTEPEHHNVDVISIQLDEWSSQMLLSDSCIVNELPLVAGGKVETIHPSTCASSEASLSEASLDYPDLQLTEEEEKLLKQEGISLPNNLPLTKTEERILKKVRRKIRNKQSAQDSRRRKKEYIDGLEGRVAACSAQNKELQRTVDQLEKHNISLLAQLRKLQSLIKQTATKAAQTSTCIMIFIFSLVLIIFPSYSPFSRGSSAVEEGYAPIGVISRSILNDPASSLQISEDSDNTVASPDDVPSPPDLSQSDPPDLTLSRPQQSPETPDIDDSVELTLEGSQLNNNSSLAEAKRTDQVDLGMMQSAIPGNANIDPTKPAHADEM